MTEIEIHDDPDVEPAALSDREWGLISRLNQISIMLARSDTREAVIKRIKAEWNIGDTEAERWLRKGEEYMASGAIEHVEGAREMFHHRLTEIYGLAMEHAVRDQVEVTTRPTRIIDKDGESVVINGKHTKVKYNALDTGALQVALKAAKDAAHLMGVKPHEGRLGVAIGTVNVHQAAPAQANTTNELANKALAELVGAEIIDVVAESVNGQGTEVLSDAAEAEETPDTDQE